MKLKLEVELDQECLKQIRSDNYLARDMSDEAICDLIEELFTQMSTRSGLSMQLENMDMFNY